MNPDWDLQTQNIAAKVVITDTIRLDSIRYVAGLDLSFFKDSAKAIACLIVMTYPDCVVGYEKFMPVTLTENYVPGYLGTKFPFFFFFQLTLCVFSIPGS